MRRKRNPPAPFTIETKYYHTFRWYDNYYDGKMEAIHNLVERDDAKEYYPVLATALRIYEWILYHTTGKFLYFLVYRTRPPAVPTDAEELAESMRIPFPLPDDNATQSFYKRVVKKLRHYTTNDGIPF